MNDPQTVYKRSPFLFYGTYVALGFIVFAYFVFTWETPGLFRFFMVMVVLIVIYVFGIQLYYFILTEKILVVKNHWFFWINKSFPLESIETIYFQDETKPVSSRGASKEAGILFFSLGKRYIFLAGTVNKKELNELVNEIKARDHKKNRHSTK
jgi:hypothetical protein